MVIAAIEQLVFGETEYVHKCTIHCREIKPAIIARMASLEDMPLELLAHILSFVPAYVPVKQPDHRPFFSHKQSTLCADRCMSIQRVNGSAVRAQVASARCFARLSLRVAHEACVA